MSVSKSLSDGTYLVPSGQAVAPLDRVLRGLQPGMSWSAVRRAIETGKVSIEGRRVTDPTTPVRPGTSIAVDTRARKPRTAGIDPKTLLHVDPYVVVVDKPAGVSSVPYEEDERDTLVDLVRTALRERERRPIPPLGVVHRLDKDTSGVMMFCRTLPAKRHLKQQFRFHTIHRVYAALAHGAVREGTLKSWLVEDRGDGLRGSTDNHVIGQEAITHVRVLRRFEGATLVECRLETGRTHQIRIHLSEAGHPVVGERVYIRRFSGQKLESQRLMLHARELGFVHPHDGRELAFQSPLPNDFERRLSALVSVPD